MILAIDIGNTTTHYGLVSGKSVSSSGKFLTRDIREHGTRILESLEYSGVAYCSVVPKAKERLGAIIAEKASVPIFHLSHTNCPGLNIDYPKPEEIGQDRLANAIAAQAFYGVPSVVIDMGTAVTFDIVTDAGYVGGIIAPGLEVMTRYLHEQTALLPSLDPEDLFTPNSIGRSTVEAMKLGCAVGFSGMIHALLERVLKELEKNGGPTPTLIGSGGSAGTLLKSIVPEIIIEPNTILIGLGEAFSRRFQ